MVLFPNAKINLGLHILQKRGDGYHDLETVFYPLALQDALEVIQNETKGDGVDFTITGLPLPAGGGENSCINAYRLLKKDFPQLPPVKMHLHKVIPTGAGLGGGSSDGAFALKLLNKKFHLGLSENDLLRYALALGSDCPFFILNKASLAHGRGERLESIDIDLSNYKIIIVHPGVHINTGWAFSQLQPEASRVALNEIITMPVTDWRHHLKNHFETVVFLSYPEIASLKEKLYEAGAAYASLSGSGSTVYGLFPKDVSPPLSFPPHYFVKEC